MKYVIYSLFQIALIYPFFNCNRENATFEGLWYIHNCIGK